MRLHVYLVQSGDSLRSVAEKFGVRAGAVARLSGLPADSGLYAGQVLFIPVTVVRCRLCRGQSAASASEGLQLGRPAESDGRELTAVIGD